MTLIMSYQKQNIRVMLGDLLVSMPSIPRQSPLSVPARPYDRFPVSNLNLSHLAQKIVILNNHLAAAWAGNALIARSILNTLRNELHEPYSGEEILSTIDGMALSDSEKNSVSFIFYALQITENDLPNLFIVQDYLVGETIFDTPDHKVKYAGSGTFHFFDTIGWKNKGHTGSMNEVEICVATVLTRAAIAFYSKIVSEDNHNYLYGGGFELLTLNPTTGQSFEKLSFASAFWQAHGKDRLQLIGPIFVNQYKDNNDLVLSRIHFKKNEAILNRFIIRHMFTADGDDYELPIPDFDPFFVVHYIVSSDKKEVGIILKKGSDKNVRMSLDKNGEFSIDFTDDVFESEALNL